MLFTWLKKSKNHIQNAFDTQGMSMIEILVVVSIIAILSVFLLFNLNRQISRAQDATRKDDLEDLRVAFEDYYNDYECYPDVSILDNCGGTDLSPYLNEIPCDPKDKEPYVGFTLGGDSCAGYRVLTQLANVDDPNIESMGCDAINGCFYADATYNYGIAMGAPLSAVNWE